MKPSLLMKKYLILFAILAFMWATFRSPIIYYVIAFIAGGLIITYDYFKVNGR